MSAAFLEWLSSVQQRVTLIWVVVCGVCIITLLVEAVILLTFWRRPSHSWRLGLFSVGAAGTVLLMMCWAVLLEGVQLAPPISGAMRVVNNCYFQDLAERCKASQLDQIAAVFHVSLVLLLIAGVTCGCVVRAFVLKAREQRPAMGNALVASVRIVSAAVGVVAGTVGLALLLLGVIEVIETWIYIQTNTGGALEFAGMGYVYGFAGGIGGLVGVGASASLLWLIGRRRAAPMPQAA